MKKKILIIGLTERMGGVETFIYNTTIFSDTQKYEYDYLVHGANECVFQKEIEEFYKTGEHIFFVRKYKQNPLGCVADLIRFYRENGKKYDFIHLQTGATSEILYVFPFCLFLKAKIIVHSHNGNGYSPIINKLFRPIVNRIAFKRLACSKEAAVWLFGKKEKAIQIINNGINNKKFKFNPIKRDSIRKEFGVNDKFVIGHIGRFSQQKNHKYILEIFSKIKEMKPNAVLMLVGVGELQGEIKHLCVSLQLEGSVIFCGKQMNTEDYYSAFDVFLMPSLYEGLPIVGIEAQCEGLPCFFSDEISEQIKITDQAYVLPLKKSPSEWALKIIEIGNKYVDRNQYAKIIDEKGYSIQRTVNDLEKVYGS